MRTRTYTSPPFLIPYTTSVGRQTWQYAHYCSVGSPDSPSRAFQTMRQLDSSGNPTAEEFHYIYDGKKRLRRGLNGFPLSCSLRSRLPHRGRGGGRLETATFAMTPQTGFTPATGQPWYDSSHHASKKARAIYDNDARSNLLNLTYTWDDVSSSWNIQAWQCGYDGITAQKTSSATQYWNSGTWGGPTETFGYDVQRGFLTNYTSNDGASGKPTSESWTYDAAGNRVSYNYGSGSQTDSVVNNLNMATQIQGVNCTNDPLGNRTLKTGIATYVWDAVNRMTAYNGSNYSYRADGLRVRKKIGYNTTTWTYAHDGQMGFEDAAYTNSGGTFTLSTWNDYALGARGIDRWTNSFPTSSTTFYPIYDPHGNQVSYLSKVTGSSYWVAPQRSYDPWGNLRLGNAGTQPNGRYCANIGHENDDENTMVYMRARYYDQASGRFISEDPAKDGANWSCYCENDPVNKIDQSGDRSSPAFLAIGALLGFTALLTACVAWRLMCVAVTPAQVVEAAGLAQAAVKMAALSLVMAGGLPSGAVGTGEFAFLAAIDQAVASLAQRCNLESMTAQASVGAKTQAWLVVGACYFYSIGAMAYIIGVDFFGGGG